MSAITEYDWAELHVSIELARREPDHNERIRLLSVVMDDLYRLTMQDCKEYVRRQPWRLTSDHRAAHDSCGQSRSR